MVKLLWTLLWGGKSKRRRSRRKKGVNSILRWFAPGLTISGVFSGILAALFGYVDLPSLDLLRGTQPPVNEPQPQDLVGSSGTRQLGRSNPLTGSQVAPAGYVSNPLAQPSIASNSASGSQSSGSIRIGSFNIKVFGTSKAGNPTVMSQIAKIVSTFDVVAIQEIRGDPSVPINELLSRLSQYGRYQAIHSSPLGRTSQKECLGFVWNASRIQMIPQSSYVVADGSGANDKLHREPYVARFQVKSPPLANARPFSFTLINVHTDPDEVRGASRDNELNVLDDVFQNIRSYEYQAFDEDDFILLGDLNVDVRGLSELGNIKGVTSLIGDQWTNTVQTKTYDHILIDQTITTEYAGNSGVLRFDEWMGLTPKQAGDISDHMPVWADFQIYEQPPFFEQQVASRDGVRR